MKPDSSSLTRLIAACAGFALLPANAGITNRWSFGNANGAAAAGTSISDSVSSQNQ